APPPSSPRFPYTTLFRSHRLARGPRIIFLGGDPVVRQVVRAARRAGRWPRRIDRRIDRRVGLIGLAAIARRQARGDDDGGEGGRSEEHTSELQSRGQLVC